MERRIADAQHALELATTEYLNACATLHLPLRVSNEPSQSHLNEISENCDKFIESTREELLKMGLRLKTARNQQACINRLPLELHVKVFEYDLDAHETDINASHFLSIRLSRIVSLSAVCTHWRKRVVETSSFWSHIPFHLSENLVALCVKRANSRPLEIRAINNRRETKYGSNEIWRGKNALGGHSHNIRSLTVVAYNLKHVYSSINWVLESSIPRSLRELSVTYTGGVRMHYNAPTEPDTRPEVRLNTLAKDLYTLSLSRINIKWNECAFEKLRVLQLNGLRALRLAEFEQALVSSPMLEVLEIARSRLYGERTSSKPLALPHLKALQLSYMEAALGTIVDMFEPGDYTTELNVGLLQDVMSPQVLKDTWIQGLERVVPKMCHVTVLGISNESYVLEGASFLSIISALPDLITLRLQDLLLEPNPLFALEKILQALPQINKLQMTRVSITDVETFQGVIERCSVQWVELINCSVFLDGEMLRIERGTPLYKWAVESAPRVSLLWE
ncbi:unnamed protein product [Rhizoctonia solani]|uniref:F-box domain-containing protein n=1 Tax=Rhizoctonia solani TaxID=456999 RepID=A0A8H3ADC6_9AGAM|nr:unnamed protein product [Rhizoctonia solani]CAE6442283.1 unnamed protein product [Rhizoctonia solani]